MKVLLGTLCLLLSTTVVSGKGSGESKKNLLLRGDGGSRDLLVSTSMSVAHLGNSMQYKNDLPRLLEHLMKERYSNYYQNSCMHGGTNVTSLWELGNGMSGKYNTSAARKHDGTFDIGAPTVKGLLEERPWDFVIINDYSQTPCRDWTRQASKTTLKLKYKPHLKDSTVIFSMTPAYKKPGIIKSKDLGNFDQFTECVLEGYKEYARVFPKAKIAPFGLAYQHIRNRYGKSGLWEKLYAPDNYHPSPHGTYLEANILYCTINGDDNLPPIYNELWWESARINDPPMAKPTEEEASMLRQAAIDTCKQFTFEISKTDNANGEAAEANGDDDSQKDHVCASPE